MRYLLLLAVFSLTAGAMFAFPAAAEEEASPDVIYLTGTVRDFMSSHPDFGIASATGHVPNNAVHSSASLRPEWLGGGFTVASQWRNSANENIPPHLSLYGFGGGGVIPVVNESDVPDGVHSFFDAYDSSLGPYHEQCPSAGSCPPPVYQVGAPMPTVIIPPWLLELPNLGEVEVQNATISQNRHYESLTIKGNVKINGHVNIVVQDRFHVQTHGKIELNPGATLNLYLVKGAEEFSGELSGSTWNHVQIGDPLDPSRVKMFNLSPYPIMIHNHAQVWAVIISPYAHLSVTNHGELFGLFAGNKVVFGNHGKIHIDNGLLPSMCNSDIEDTIGTMSASSNGAIDSAESMDQWFTDHLGVNMSFPHTIALTKNASGIYEYLDDAFFPIDDMLFGNEGAAHNFNFTFMFSASFEFEQCGEQFIEFEGADDVWVYINNGLAMDLGGVKALTPQVVELDRLHLVNGETYHLRFYYAQRNTDMAVFKLRTNVELQGTTTNSITGLFD